jgi:hypothetical protein
MANDVERTSAREVDPYAEYANEVSSRPFAGDLLRFTKHGEYKAGQEQEVIDEGVKMLVYMPGMKRGWVKWAEQQPVTHIMGLVNEGFRPPPREELGDDNEDEWETLNDRPIDPWQMTNYLPMCDIKGNLFTFVTASKGGLSAIGLISEAYAMRRRMKPDEIPVIELLSRSYQHKDFGETFAPLFKIVGWTAIPTTFTELTAAIEDGSNETLSLDSLMSSNGSDGDEPDDDGDEPEEEVTRKTAPQKPKASASAKPAGKASAKPAGKAQAHRTAAAFKGKPSTAKRSVRL